MDSLLNIKSISDYVVNNRIGLPKKAGVYAFWWISSLEKLLSANREIVLYGPAGSPIKVEFNAWWPNILKHPCLYIGKTTNIKNRFSQHIKRGSKGRLHHIPDSNFKQKAVTTTCQVRYGIEHLFKYDKNPLQILLDNVGFSYSTDFGDNGIVERFYTEDKLIGTWRPWFSIDSER